MLESLMNALHRLPVVKLVELYASDEYLPLCLYCADTLIGPDCTLPLCEGYSYATVYIHYLVQWWT